MQTVLIPGKGEWNSSATKVDEAINLYDERLSFRRNLDTGDWCIYIATGHGVGTPILGFGQEVPSPAFALKRLWETDTMRHGEKILEQMNRRNKEVDKILEAKSNEASGQTAEVMEWGFRKMEKHPKPQIFIPKDIPK